MKRKGGISVFLALMLSVLSSFVLTLSGHAQKYICKSEAVYATDCAVKSCFAEYNRELFDRFHILLIDSSYKTEEGGLDRVKDHFSMYLSNSLTVNELCDVSVTECEGSLPEKVQNELTDDLIGYMRDNGSPGFDPNNCFCALEFTATFSSPSTGNYSITRKYSYDDLM